MIRIAVDAFGGDNSPGAVVEGAGRALADYDDIELVLTGDEKALNAEITKAGINDKRLSIVDAPDVIDCHEQPTVAIKRKTESSLVKALRLVADGEVEAVVSAGSTGALLTGATLIIRRLRGVKRPALAPLMPTEKGGWVMLIDCGANTDCKPSYLQQFAVMASAYMTNVMGVEKPKIALLNNGEEAEKGNALTKAAYRLFENTPIEFYGNSEARDILSGKFDALVCDGFAGNVVLKYTEGLSATIFTMLKAELMSDTRSKIGAALAKPAFKRMKKRMDYKEIGGAPLLGINGCVIKAHGSSDARAFRSAIMQARSFAMGNVNASIEKAIEELPATED